MVFIYITFAKILLQVCAQSINENSLVSYHCRYHGDEPEPEGTAF